MIRLIILLLGAQAQRPARLLVLFGWLWAAAGALMLFDILQDGRSCWRWMRWRSSALEGLVAISAALVIGSSASRPVLLGAGLRVYGLLMLDVPADDGIVATVVLAARCCLTAPCASPPR